MTVHTGDHAELDLTRLSPQVREVIESIMESGAVAFTRSGEPVGTVTFRPAVLEGTLLPPADGDANDRPPERGDVTVVATTMLMSDAARTRLSEAFGSEYLVLDFADAPSTADIVLTHAVSHQLIGRWTVMFPQARILVTEILDEELGLDVRGPVGRLLDAGADAYFPPRPVAQVAQGVRGYLAAHAAAEIGTGERGVIELGPPDAG